VSGSGTTNELAWFNGTNSITSSSAIYRNANGLNVTENYDVNTAGAFKGFRRLMSGLAHGVTNKLPTDMAWGMTDYSSTSFPNYYMVGVGKSTFPVMYYDAVRLNTPTSSYYTFNASYASGSGTTSADNAANLFSVTNNGADRFTLKGNGDVRTWGALYNASNSSGTSGQVLTSQGSGAWTWADATSTNIYNSNGSIPSSTTRIVSLPSNSTLELGTVGSGRGTLQIANGLGATLSYGSPTQGILGVNNLGAFIQFGGAGDTYVSANSNSHVKIRTNGTTGTANQVLTANSSADAVWQNNPALDNLYNTSTGSVTFNTGSDAAVFGIGVDAQYCSATSTTFTKSSSSAVYEIDIVIDASASLGDESIFLGLFRSGSQIRSCKQFNAVATTGTDMIFKFMTDSSSGGLTIRNIGAATFTGTVKHIAIKRLR
jgi:hypothetical protein